MIMIFTIGIVTIGKTTLAKNCYQNRYSLL